MKFKTTREDMLLAVRRLSFASPESLPLTFKLGDRVVSGIPEDFRPKTEKKLFGSSATETVITGINDKGLEIRAEVIEYRDFPVAEYTVYFTNKGTEDTEILSGINALNKEFCGENPVLVHGNGEVISEEGFKFFEDAITGEGITISPIDDGTSCNGAYPFLRVRFEDYVLTAAIGWTGTWQASFTPSEMGLTMTAGQKYANFKILPGETMRTPRICLMVTDTSDELRSMNIWRHFYNAHIMPKQWGENIPPKSSMHVHAYRGKEMTGATEDNQISGLKRFLKRGMKPDMWWFDAGFYKCGGDWHITGTWKADPVRFPNCGLAPLGEECAKNGVDLMVWFEPERVVPGTEIEVEHPDFLLRAKKDDGRFERNSLFNYGNPEALNWMIERVDSLIKMWRIAIYRQDFNFPPFKYWRQNEAPDRLGALENLSIQGYYKFWDELLFRNPGLFIDTCASGGRRNDLETLRRSVPYQYTDIGIREPAQKQRQHLMLFEWAPYFRAHTYACETGETAVGDYAWFNAFAPACTWTVPAWGSEEEFETGRKMMPIWKRAAELELRAEYFPQMKADYGKELTQFFCTHFYDADRGDGFVLFMRNKDCEQEEFTAKLALCPCCSYYVENPVTGESYTASGKDLQTFTQKLDKRTGAVWFFRKA